MPTTPQPTALALRMGLPVAAISGVSYALAGPVARGLLDAGWSPAAVALVRVGGAAVILLVPTVVLLARAGSRARTWAPSLLGYGVIAIAGVQVCFFNAIQYAPVSSVLLIEYLAPVLLMFWTWARTGQAPSSTVLLGAAIAVAGLTSVIGVVGGNLGFHPLGMLWAFGAALCLTAYFAMAASGRRPPALVLTGGGMVVGSVVILIASALGVMPLTATFGQVDFAGHSMSFLVPAAILALVCALLAYLSGILAIRFLGARIASFASLSEVILAVIAAWILLGEQPTARQAVGGAIVLTGIVLIGLDDGRVTRLVNMGWFGRSLASAGRRLGRHTVRRRRSRRTSATGDMTTHARSAGTTRRPGQTPRRTRTQAGVPDSDVSMRLTGPNPRLRRSRRRKPAGRDRA